MTNASSASVASPQVYGDSARFARFCRGRSPFFPAACPHHSWRPGMLRRHESCDSSATDQTMDPRRHPVCRLVVLCWVALRAAPVSAQNPAVTITVAHDVSRHPINANIYGVAHATTAELSDLNVPLNRNGGNNTTRYNWQLNADNRGNDWYFESIGDSSATAGERGDTFIASSKAAGAQAMLTVPMIDWIAKLGPNRSKLASFSIAKYGAQTANDWQWFPDAGNGIRTSGQNVTGNDPNDANVPSTSLFQQGWIQHLVGRWGTSTNSGLRYYILDNEP